MNIIEFYRENENFGEFSNFFKLNKSIIYNDKEYTTSEHFYQSLKYLRDDSTDLEKEYAELIRTQNTPNKARILARMEKNYRYPWMLKLNDIIDNYKNKGLSIKILDDNILLNNMYKILSIKFNIDNNLKLLLISTNECILIEKSPYDSFWGGYLENSKNHLGNILMKLRTELKDNIV